MLACFKKEEVKMPFIDAKFSLKLDENQKKEIQLKLTDVVSDGFSKPKAYIMTNIEDDKTLFMADKKLDNGAYISISLLGSAAKSSCQAITNSICNILNSELGIEGSNVYITYHPTELWGWNGSMF